MSHAWFVGAHGVEGVFEAMDIMKCDPAECDDEGKDRWVEFLKKNGRWDDAKCSAEKTDSVFLDGGGMVMIKEAKVAWEANGCKFETYARQIPILLGTFKRILGRPVPEFPSCTGFGGFCRKYFFSLKTVTDSIPILERLAVETDEDRLKTEGELQDALNRTPNATSVRTCSCDSGRQYADCCGKGTESPEQNSLRRGITMNQVEKN